MGEAEIGVSQVQNQSELHCEILSQKASAGDVAQWQNVHPALEDPGFHSHH
jgi:hypothetical protein